MIALRLRRGLPLLLLGLLISEGLAEEGWRELRSEHFFVYHRGSAAFARDVAASAERHYDRIVRDIGHANHGDFWKWDRRASIYVYRSRQAFAVAREAPRWAGGSANYQRREISTFEGSASFLERVLPHEVAHLVFREYVGQGDHIPLWVDEGIAQFQEAGSLPVFLPRLRGLHHNQRWFSVAALGRVRQEDLARSPVAALFYAQAGGMVGYMIEELGRPRFGTFCRRLRQGKALEEALRFTYSPRIRTLEELNEAWQVHLQRALKEAS